MSLGDRIREWLAQAAGRPARRPRSQAQPIASARCDQRPLQRSQWIALGLAAAAAVALTAGLVFVILTLTRPGEPRAAPTPTAPVLLASPTARPASDIFATSTPTVGLAPPTPTFPPTRERVQVANTQGEGVNMRREPSASAERIRIIPEGSILDVVGPDRDAEGRQWRYVRDLDGEMGWIQSSFLVAEGSATPAPAAVAAGTTTVAGTPAAAVTPAPARTPAAPRPTTAAAAATSTSAPRPSGSQAQIGNTDRQGANIRSEPGSGGRVLKTLPEGAPVEVLGPEREVDGRVWRQVRDSAGVTGWIVGGALAAPGTVPTPVPPGARPPATTAPGPAGATPAATTAPAGTPAPIPTARPGTPTTPGPSIIQPAPIPNLTTTPAGAARTPTPTR